jgi:hypothetical protein
MKYSFGNGHQILFASHVMHGICVRINIKYSKKQLAGNNHLPVINALAPGDLAKVF